MQSGAGVPQSKVRPKRLTNNNKDKRQILNQIISLNLVDSVGEFSVLHNDETSQKYEKTILEI
jgi:hypothetical protein